MTFPNDDEGEGGVWPMMTSSQKSKILGNFLGFFRNFIKIFSNLRIKDKISRVNFKLVQIVSGLLQGIVY